MLKSVWHGHKQGRYEKERRESSCTTYRLVDKRVTCVGAVIGLVGAASAAPMQRHAAREVELTGGFWVFFGDLNAHLSGLAWGPLYLLKDDWKHVIKQLHLVCWHSECDYKRALWVLIFLLLVVLGWWQEINNLSNNVTNLNVPVFFPTRLLFSIYCLYYLLLSVSSAMKSVWLSTIVF